MVYTSEYEIVDNDEFRNLCFDATKSKKVGVHLLTRKTPLPKSITDMYYSRYYLAKNTYLGFGYWNPSVNDPNIWTSVEDEKGKTQKLKESINESVQCGGIIYFYY